MNELITSVILIGGQSSRFESPKHLATYNNQSFLSIIEQALSPLEIKYSVHTLDTNLPSDKQIVDDNYRIGPINGIANSLAASNSKFTLITSCDLPLLTNALVMNMVGLAVAHDQSVVAYLDGYPIPTFAVYKTSEAIKFQSAITSNQYRLMSVLQELDHFQYQVADEDARCLTNVNTKAQLRALSRPFVFAVSGFKNSGKTTLISKLISRYQQDGFRVAVLKHDGHDFEVSNQTDTGKFMQRGSESTTVYSDSKFQTTTIGKFDINQWLNNVKDYDIAIIEGMKDSAYPKIVIEDKTQPVAANNRIITVDAYTRNQIEVIYQKLSEVENERFK